MKVRIVFLAILLGCISLPICGQGQAPTDKPVSAKSDEDVKKFEEAIAPYVKNARERLPDAKKRFLKGCRRATSSS
jgi:hypothetical protein